MYHVLAFRTVACSVSWGFVMAVAVFLGGQVKHRPYICTSKRCAHSLILFYLGESDVEVSSPYKDCKNRSVHKTAGGSTLDLSRLLSCLRTLDLVSYDNCYAMNMLCRYLCSAL